MQQIHYIPLSEIQRIRQSVHDPVVLSNLLSVLFKINTLYMITNAGSGHIGSSFSAMDVVTWLWSVEMRQPNEPGGDVYFSSKGHDAPGLYAALIGLEKLDFDLLHQLRRLNGLPGHPDVGTPNIPTNTGSLGMGVAKARGMAQARRLTGAKARFFVLTGDGELQEGQLWESLQPTANQQYAEITVIVDHNKLQSDTLVEKVSDLGDLEAKFRSFGWAVFRTDGHDVESFKNSLAEAAAITDRPQVIIADTLKGKGVSFMEKPPTDDLYKYHSGAPSEEDYDAAYAELSEALSALCEKAGVQPVRYEHGARPEKNTLASPEKLVDAYGDELVKIAEKHQEVIAMDADLVLDTGLVAFKKKFPDRYAECGIAEQDMVSFAGGLALEGKLPVVHSFECFLSTRPNEQIYNNATEHTKIIYVGSLAGILPGGPGHSHQSVRGISALGSVPGLTLIQPANEQETRAALGWAVEENDKSTYIRLVSIPSELGYSLPEDYSLERGKGTVLAHGTDAAIVAYGPTMLSEAYKASQKLKERNISVAVINMPWLNVVDDAWLAETLKPYRAVITLDDHYKTYGQNYLLATALLRAGVQPRVISLGLDTIPACGKNDEVLAHHGLDAAHIEQTIIELL